MTTDDLSAPLGQKRPRSKRQYRLPFTVPQATAVLFGLFLAGFLGFAIFNDNPLGGEPIVARPYDPVTTSPGEKPPGKSIQLTEIGTTAPQPAAGQKTVTIIDGSNGVRQDVTIGMDDTANAKGTKPAMAAINSRLLEKSRYGMIPIAADGLKPFNAYAGGSEDERTRATNIPSIAIVITGLGVGAAKTADAIVKLPGAVTLAFTPYGSDPAKFAERARAQKHEVLLQIPMEPFDYPDNDPGPQTLLTALTAEQNADRMAWHMSRFQGYVGLASFMGSRFLATDAAMQPLIKEAARRGLGYLDDGSVPRSVAGVVAQAHAVPFARADLTIDAVPTPIEINKTLSRLEAIAKERGTAIGVASALPVSIEYIGAWAKQIESRGFILVPLTTAMLKSKSG